MTTPLTTFITIADLDTFIGGDEKARLSAGGLTPERYAQTIADVNSEIAGNVGARVLASIPAAFIHHGCAIARYRLNKDKSSEKMKQDLDLANKFFSNVQAGLVYLPIAPEENPSGVGVWFTAQPNRVNGRVY